MKKLALFASGSGSNVENFAQYFHSKSDISVALVLCNNPKAFVIERCKRLSIPCVVFDRQLFYDTDNIIQILRNYQIDMVVLAGFLWLIPPYLIQEYPNKIVNVHPALLPKFGGKGMYGEKVHKAVVDAGEKMSGITVHYVNEHFDEGKIIFQAQCVVNNNDTPYDVAQKVHALEYEHFPKVVEKLLIEPKS